MALVLKMHFLSHSQIVIQSKWNPIIGGVGFNANLIQLKGKKNLFSGNFKRQKVFVSEPFSATLLHIINIYLPKNPFGERKVFQKVLSQLNCVQMNICW